MASVLTVLYFDLRVRKEGFDLRLLARGVGQDASAYATSAQAVGEASGLGAGGFAPPAQPPPGGGFAPPAPPPQSGGFAPPQAPGSTPPDEPGGSTPPPSTPPPAPRGGGLQSGDPLGPPPERRGEGEAGS
jgi:hypothetical protein